MKALKPALFANNIPSNYSIPQVFTLIMHQLGSPKVAKHLDNLQHSQVLLPLVNAA
jgi:hypothetical protein